MISTVVATAALWLLPLLCGASIELVAPVSGEVVARVPDAQKKVMAPSTLEERIRLFREDRKHGKVIRHDAFWRKPLPLVLKWRATGGERGPWKVEIGKSPDLSDARAWYVRTSKTDKVSGRDSGKAEPGDGDVSYTVPMPNLEIACDYYWRIAVRGRCGKWNCGPRCDCKERLRIVRSGIGHFRTEDHAPRWIEIEGAVHNMRDFGGWRTTDGRRVRQGMAYRGQGLNSNSVTGESQGRNRLTAEDIKYLKGTLGIRTDLDLRSSNETADMTESPLGSGVAFIRRSSDSYKGIFSDRGKKAMAANFRVFCSPTNYPVYFHCIGGADRTGALAYVMLGVLGVDRRDIETDWESTFYPNIPDDKHGPDHWCLEAHFNNGFSKYGKDGDSWNRRIELYLLDCGITEEEIAVFRRIMLVGAKK